jgi:acyl-CoA thioesterase-1
LIFGKEPKEVTDMFDLRKSIGVWGDSVLKGVIFDELRGTYRLLTENCGNLITKALGLKILNRSRFGSTIEKGRATLEKSLRKGLDCDYLLLEYGGNDCDFNWEEVSQDPKLPHQPNTPIERFKANLQEMVDLIRNHGITPLLMSLPPIHAERYFEFIVSRGLDRENIMSFLGDCQQIYRFHEMYSLAVTGIAHRNQCAYIPMREAFLAERDMPSLLCSDGIHPNERGHQLMERVFSDLALAGTVSV